MACLTSWTFPRLCHTQSHKQVLYSSAESIRLCVTLPGLSFFLPQIKMTPAMEVLQYVLIVILVGVCLYWIVDIFCRIADFRKGPLSTLPTTEVSAPRAAAASAIASSSTPFATPVVPLKKTKKRKRTLSSATLADSSSTASDSSSTASDYSSTAPSAYTLTVPKKARSKS